MPTKLNLKGGYFTDEEAATIKEKADAKGLTVANWFRVRAGFKPLKAGAPKGNQRAKGNKGRWG